MLLSTTRKDTHSHIEQIEGTQVIYIEIKIMIIRVCMRYSVDMDYQGNGHVIYDGTTCN